MSNSTLEKYPLLKEILNIKGIQLQPTYTIGDFARIFNVSIRTAQSQVASGKIMSRALPGRAKFLPQDIEAFLVASSKPRQRHGRTFYGDQAAA